MDIPEINQHIGRRLRAERRRRNLTQSQVASACGVSFQQIQKYESGRVVISAEKLWLMSNILETAVSEFFPWRDAVTAAQAEGRASTAH
jgi:transcriptional regulator with XRE-family HTH domain